MKFLKYLLVTVVVLVVLFFSVGLLKPAVDYGHEITVNKPIEEAWAVMQDESKYDQWLDGFKSIELISGEAGTVGSKYKVIVNPGGGQPDFEMIETIVSIEEFDHISLHFDSDMMDFEQTSSFTDNDGVVTIKTESKVIGKSISMRSMFALMEMFGGGFTKQEAKNIDALGKLIDENTTDYYPAPVEIEAEGPSEEEALE